MPRRERRHSERLTEARRIELIPLAKVAAGLAAVSAIASHLALRASVRNVRRTFGAFTLGTNEKDLLFWLPNYVAGGCLIAGAIGLIKRKTWGWWLVLLGAIGGLGDMARIYRGLFGIINPDHPKAGETAARILQMISGPALLYVGLIVLLCLRPMRQNYRV